MIDASDAYGSMGMSISTCSKTASHVGGYFLRGFCRKVEAY
jgi:hypothetical protein